MGRDHVQDSCTDSAIGPSATAGGSSSAGWPSSSPSSPPSAAWGGATSDVFEIPGTESQRAADLLDERFPEQGGSSARLVFAAPDGEPLTDAENRQAIEDDARRRWPTPPGSSPWPSPFDDRHRLGRRADIAFADVGYGVSGRRGAGRGSSTALEAAVAPAEEAGVQVEFGGEVGATEELGHTSELIGLGVAVDRAAVLVRLASSPWACRSSPPCSASGSASPGITLVAGFTDLSSTAPTLAMMIGLAVGIDYALFIVTRHRQNLAEGPRVEESAARANATAGGAVVFAGMTVVIALAGLAVIGIPFLTVMGLAAAVTVFLAVVIAVTMLPALLGFAGHSIDRWRVGRARTGSAAESHDTLSARWARQGHRPAPAWRCVGGLAIMLLLADPGAVDASGHAGRRLAARGHDAARQAYDLLAEGFGPGFNGPLPIVVDTADAADPEAALSRRWRPRSPTTRAS